MEENNLDALFVEPNAYIQFKDCKCKQNEVKKVIFPEPYENFPNYYLKEEFKKPKCDFCNKKPQQTKQQNKFPFLFDLKNLMPLFSMFGGKSKGIKDIISVLGNQTGGNNSSMLSTLLQNSDIVTGALNLFKGGGLNFLKQKKENQKQAKTTDFQINNYTRVE